MKNLSNHDNISWPLGSNWFAAKSWSWEIIQEREALLTIYHHFYARPIYLGSLPRSRTCSQFFPRAHLSTICWELFERPRVLRIAVVHQLATRSHKIQSSFWQIIRSFRLITPSKMLISLHFRKEIIKQKMPDCLQIFPQLGSWKNNCKVNLVMCHFLAMPRPIWRFSSQRKGSRLKIVELPNGSSSSRNRPAILSKFVYTIWKLPVLYKNE